MTVDGPYLLVRGVVCATIWGRHVFEDQIPIESINFSRTKVYRHPELLQLMDSLRNLINGTRSVTKTDNTFLEDLHRILTLDYELESFFEINTTLIETTVSRRFGVSVGLLRLRFFGHLLVLAQQLDSDAWYTRLPSLLKFYFTGYKVNDRVTEARGYTDAIGKLSKQLHPSVYKVFGALLACSHLINVFIYLRHIPEMHRDMAFVVMSTSDVGIAYHTVNIGDTVAFITGCRCPMILRKVGQHEHLVGPAHVPEIKYEEKWPQDASILQDIVLA